MFKPKTTLIVAFCALFITSHALCQDMEIDISESEIALVKVHPYENTQWKRARNSILYWIAPNVLRNIWPSDGYDVQKVRNLCSDRGLSDTASLGSNLTFVRNLEREQTSMAQMKAAAPYDGFTIDFKRSNDSGPTLENLCPWLEEVNEDETSNAITGLLLNYGAFNPIPGGSWKKMEFGDNHNDWTRKSNNLQPIIEGELVSHQNGNWISAINNLSIALSPASSNVEISDLSKARAVWEYQVNGDNESPGYYITLKDNQEPNNEYLCNTNEVIDFTSQGYQKFNWECPPVKNFENQIVIWADQNITQDYIDDGWYLVTNVGFANTKPSRYFENNVLGVTSRTFDPDEFIVPQNP
ncbi:MAG: hypothetical protein OXG88_09625 [Gammaproteobacteria bacterium]|nr:hypothetical protein [Gammaproteobacteria bacterium]